MAKTTTPSLSRFAHLAGASAAADEDEKKDDKANDQKKDDDKKADEDGDDTDEKLEDLEKRVDDLEEDEDEEDKKDEKVASAARVAKAVVAGRKAERARCAAIFTAPSAGGNPALAAQLAFGTDLQPRAAIGVLTSAGRAAPAPAARRGLNERMDGAPSMRVGGDGPGAPNRDTHEGAAAFVLGAAKSARGDK